MSKAKRYSVVIPFSGFYESDHSDLIDEAIKDLFQNDAGDCEMPEAFYTDENGYAGLWEVNYSDLYREYAREYVSWFNDYLTDNADYDLGLEPEEDVLDSPSEYNFTTDRIFATVTHKTVLHMMKDTDPVILANQIKANHTSRSGFHSFYSNDLAVWQAKPIRTWDHNELTTLLQAWLISTGIGNPDVYDVTEYARCNGVIDGMAYKHLTVKGKALADEYQAQRELDEMRV